MENSMKQQHETEDRNILIFPVGKHPYNGLHDETLLSDTTRWLIVGSFPPPRYVSFGGQLRQRLPEGDMDYYYGSRNNAFWSLLQEVFGQNWSLDAADKEIPKHLIKSWLRKHNVGVVDIIQTAARRGNSASDSSLQVFSTVPVGGILPLMPQIERVFCTSFYVNDLLIKQMRVDPGIRALAVDPEDRRLLHVELEDMKLDIYTLISPSPQAFKSLARDPLYRANPGAWPSLAAFRLEQYRRALLPVLEKEGLKKHEPDFT